MVALRILFDILQRNGFEEIKFLDQSSEDNFILPSSKLLNATNNNLDEFQFLDVFINLMKSLLDVKHIKNKPDSSFETDSISFKLFSISAKGILKLMTNGK